MKALDNKYQAAAPPGQLVWSQATNTDPSSDSLGGLISRLWIRSAIAANPRPPSTSVLTTPFHTAGSHRTNCRLFQKSNSVGWSPIPRPRNISPTPCFSKRCAVSAVVQGSGLNYLHAETRRFERDDPASHWPRSSYTSIITNLDSLDTPSLSDSASISERLKRKRDSIDSNIYRRASVSYSQETGYQKEARPSIRATRPLFFLVTIHRGVELPDSLPWTPRLLCLRSCCE